MSNGYATQQLLKTINHHHHHRDDEVVLGPESFGLPRPDRIDPHDVEGRKWFRRCLITLCIVGFAIVFMPDFVRARLNTWAGTPTSSRPTQSASLNCTNDWSERCLVCQHLLATGEYVKTTHC